jgi:membrane-associated phospholipid phosphatase
MRAQDYFVNLVLSVILIVGAYQFYFLPQRRPLRAPRSFHSPLDEAMPFWPVWSWVYSFLYYPAILYLNWLVRDARHFVMMAFSFIVLLLAQLLIFYLFPVETPRHWRSINTGESLSERFLLFVQRFDGPTNCFPSMHVSVAMMTALHAASTLGPMAYAFPALIAVSCVFTKQHYMIDLVFGALLGWGVYLGYMALIVG